MEKDVRKLIGICGLYRGTCPSYLAHRKNDVEMLEKMSRERGYSIEELRCDGCLSDKVAPHCVDCRHGFRKCAAEKQVTWCFECTDFPCRRLRDFTNVHVVNGISHHEHIIEEDEYMRDHGIEPWVEKQEAAAKCPGCGETLYWHVRECGNCHSKVR
ncbi:MAG: DUF3795 domain-containing protein [Patescibacteria group bacterium]